MGAGADLLSPPSLRYDVPLVADIHFSPKVAMLVADAFEKIRINPGNFYDGRKSFEASGLQTGGERDGATCTCRLPQSYMLMRCATGAPSPPQVINYDDPKQFNAEKEEIR